ncbi:MAG: Na/Pi symporter [Myxococcales bacterium]|nr:Na/Pi symporter [Myxococcales bacterium]
MRQILGIAAFGYLFFLAIDLLGTGMKSSFKEPIKHFLEVNAASFNELVSFVIGILGTALIQSSSSVTSMSVVLVQEGIMPIVIAAGVVHGANLGTSVTSSFVAFATAAKKLTGNPMRDVYDLLFAPRGPGFRDAVGTAVVHDMFNIIMITAILLLLELPFGLILSSSEWMAGQLAGMTTSYDWIRDVIAWVSPGTYTGPIADGLIDASVPGWVLALLGVPLLFASLRGFAGRMSAFVMSGVKTEDPKDIGRLLLGSNRYSTFVRGLVLTILVQSSSATTSMVVPLAALGFFDVRKVFPFILGANVGTTTTALLAATGKLGQEGFHDGMTIALCHLFLNLLAVAIVWVVPGLQGSIIGAASWLADQSARVPAALLGYLVVLVVVTPAVVYVFPLPAAAAFMACCTVLLLVAPHRYLRRHPETPTAGA